MALRTSSDSSSSAAFSFFLKFPLRSFFTNPATHAIYSSLCFLEHKCKQQAVSSGRRGGMERLNNAHVRIIARLSHAHRPRPHTNILPESSAGILGKNGRKRKKILLVTGVG